MEPEAVGGGAPKPASHRKRNAAVFAIVVSGYSGGDIVACQAAGAMNMNKGFWLPANFCLLETANDKGEALALPGIQDRADRFAENMLCQLAY